MTAQGHSVGGRAVRTTRLEEPVAACKVKPFGSLSGTPLTRHFSALVFAGTAIARKVDDASALDERNWIRRIDPSRAA
jgi:hypothetical protein